MIVGSMKLRAYDFKGESMRLQSDLTFNWLKVHGLLVVPKIHFARNKGLTWAYLGGSQIKPPK